MGPLLLASLFSLASASLGSPSSPHPPSQLTACPSDCSFHGVCIRSTCECDLGWTSADCSLSVLSAISEGVRELIPQAKALPPAPPRTPPKPLTATVPLPYLTPIPCLTPMPHSQFALLFLTLISHHHTNTPQNHYVTLSHVRFPHTWQSRVFSPCPLVLLTSQNGPSRGGTHLLLRGFNFVNSSRARCRFSLLDGGATSRQKSHSAFPPPHHHFVTHHLPKFHPAGLPSQSLTSHSSVLSHPILCVNVYHTTSPPPQPHPTPTPTPLPILTSRTPQTLETAATFLHHQLVSCRTPPAAFAMGATPRVYYRAGGEQAEEEHGARGDTLFYPNSGSWSDLLAGGSAPNGAQPPRALHLPRARWRVELGLEPPHFTNNGHVFEQWTTELWGAAPAGGPIDGGTLVRIDGSGFFQPTPPATPRCRFGAQEVSPSALPATPPPAPPYESPP